MKLLGREHVFYWLWMTAFMVGFIAFGAWFVYCLLYPGRAHRAVQLPDYILCGKARCDDDAKRYWI